MRSRGPITRRGFLRGVLGVAGAAGVGLAAGCDVFGADPAQPDQPDPLAGFLRDTAALAGLYDAALARLPELGPQINTLRDAHREHVRVLAQAINETAPTTPASPGTAPGQDRASVLAGLVAAETKAQAAAVEACLGATARLAPLVGSIAAARATHLEVLR